MSDEEIPQFKTFGDFVAYAYPLSQDLYVSSGFHWLRESFTDEKWKAEKAKLFTPGVLTGFITYMQSSIQIRLGMICTDALYTKTYYGGHAFMRHMHEVAQASGLELALEEVDVPLSTVDYLRQADLISIGDRGEIRPAQSE